MRLDGWLILVAFALIAASTAFARSKYEVIFSIGIAMVLAAIVIRQFV